MPEHFSCLQQHRVSTVLRPSPQNIEHKVPFAVQKQAYFALGCSSSSKRCIEGSFKILQKETRKSCLPCSSLAYSTFRSRKVDGQATPTTQRERFTSNDAGRLLQMDCTVNACFLLNPKEEHTFINVFTYVGISFTNLLLQIYRL